MPDKENFNCVIQAIDGYNGAVSDVQSALGVNCGMSTDRNGVIVIDE